MEHQGKEQGGRLVGKFCVDATVARSGGGNASASGIAGSWGQVGRSEGGISNFGRRDGKTPTIPASPAK